MRVAAWALAIAGAALAAGWGVGTARRAEEGGTAPSGTVLLDGSLEPLRQAFGRQAGERRLLAVLSPACPVCLAGAEAIGQALAADPGLHALVVWMETLPWDRAVKAERRVELFAGEPRVAQFYDPGQLTGEAVARAVGWRGGPAWDVYLIYAAGAVWEGRLPAPGSWFHQQPAADAARFRTGEALVEALAVRPGAS